MKNRISLIAGILMMATVAGTGLSHADGTKNTKENSAQDRRIRYQENMNKSSKDIMAISSSIDTLLKTVKEAKATNDKSKMKAALEASEKHLMEMKTNTESCMHNMDAMHKDMDMDMDMNMDKHMEKDMKKAP